jgi:hypothetical protein
MVTLYATNSTNDLAHSGRPRDTTARQDMYIINVIADDESKIGLYEIYFLFK